jgi:hypothetical protein
LYFRLFEGIETMTYSLVSAVARKRNSVEPWASVDISSMSFSQIYSAFARCIVTLSNNLLPNNVYLDLAAIQATAGLNFTTQTFISYLANLGNKSLPTTAQPPSTALTPVLYGDAWQAGFSCDVANASVAPSVPLPIMDKHDVLLTRANTDYSFMAQHALITINGFFHYSGGVSNNGVYAIGGADTWRKGNDNQVGIYSFANVASLQLIPITESMIYKQTELQELGEFTYLNVGQSFSGKTPMLVLGGYLHALDGCYDVVGNGQLRINFNKIPLPERIFESRKYLDLSSVPFASTANNPNQIAVSDLTNDAVIKAYLTLSQSFIVLVNTPYMYRRKWKLEQPKQPGRYYGYQQNLALFPLLGYVGRFRECVVKYDWGTYVFCTAENWKPNYLFRRTDWENQVSLDSSLVGSQPISWLPGYVLELGMQP